MLMQEFFQTSRWLIRKTKHEMINSCQQYLQRTCQSKKLKELEPCLNLFAPIESSMT